MSYYESVFIARQDISAPQVETLADGFTEIISGGGGNVTKREYWGLRNLAYRIKKNRKGHYMLLNIDAPSAAILEMERNMRISEDILRYMTIRVDELEEGPSVMARSRTTRDDHRGRRDGHHDRGPRRDGGPAKDDRPAKEAVTPAAPSDATVPSGDEKAGPSGEEKKAETPAAKTGEDKAPAETAKPETAKPETAKAETAKAETAPETAKDSAATETAPETAKDAETAKDSGGAETATEGDKT